MGRIDTDSGRKRELAHILFSRFPQKEVKRVDSLVPQNLILLPEAHLTLERALLVDGVVNDISYVLPNTRVALAEPFAKISLRAHHSRDMYEENPMLTLHAIFDLQKKKILARRDKGFYGPDRRSRVQQALGEVGVAMTPATGELEQGTFLLSTEKLQHLEIKLDLGNDDGSMEDMVARFSAKAGFSSADRQEKTPAHLERIEVSGTFYNLSASTRAEQLVPDYIEFQRVLNLLPNVISDEFHGHSIPVLPYQTR